jgi:hypothetical protein
MLTVLSAPLKIEIGIIFSFFTDYITPSLGLPLGPRTNFVSQLAFLVEYRLRRGNRNQS